MSDQSPQFAPSCFFNPDLSPKAEAVVDSLPFKVYTLNPGGDLKYLNRFGWEYFAQDITDVGWAKAVHPDDLGRTVSFLESLIEDRKEGTIEFRMRRRDGEYRHNVSRLSPTSDDDGNFLGWIGASFDTEDILKVD